MVVKFVICFSLTGFMGISTSDLMLLISVKYNQWVISLSHTLTPNSHRNKMNLSVKQTHHKDIKSIMYGN